MALGNKSASTGVKRLYAIDRVIFHVESFLTGQRIDQFYNGLVTVYGGSRRLIHQDF